MATRTVKARVELDGEREYKQALSELNQGNKVLASEMKKLQAEYKGNADSTEFLTKKGDLLQRQLQQQRDKIDTLREALQKSAEKYGEADKRTQDWIVKLNNAEAAEYDLQHAIEENNAALNGENQTMEGLGDTVDALASKLGINIPDGAKNALNGINGLSTASVTKFAAIAAAVTAVIKVLGEMHKMTLEAAAQVDELITTSMTTGLTTQTLQEMEYASNLIDVSVDTISGSLRKLTTNMKNANDGNSTMAASFARLGVSITDTNGNLRSSEEVFYEIIDVLGQYENETERDAIAMELFGKSAQDLNPLIIQGSDALREYAQEAANVGYILSEDEVAALGAVDDAYQRVGLTVEALKNQIAADFAPASKSAMELFANVVQTAGEWLERSGLIENLASMISSLFSILENVRQLVTDLPGLGTAFDAVNTVLKVTAYLFATIADAANIVTGILTLNFDQVKTGLGWNINNGEMSNIQQLKYSGDEYVSYNATGNDNWRGGLTWVGESGPELVSLPRGSSISNAQDSRNMGGVNIGTIVIDAKNVKDFNDVVNVFNGLRVAQRMG